MISKSDALDIAKKLYGSRDTINYTVYDYIETNFRGFTSCKPERLWCVTVIDDKDRDVLKATTIALVHKETGDVEYHGSGNDEG